jgi:hypothetical protein
MKVLSIRKQKDGSALMTLELNPKEEGVLFRYGLQLAVGKKAKVLTMEEAKRLKIRPKKRWEISDEESRLCIEKAVNDILRKAIRRK